MKDEKIVLELIMDLQQLKLNYLSMMIDFIQKSGDKINEDDKEDLKLLFLFLNKKKAL